MRLDEFARALPEHYARMSLDFAVSRCDNNSAVYNINMLPLKKTIGKKDLLSLVGSFLAKAATQGPLPIGVCFDGGGSNNWLNLALLGATWLQGDTGYFAGVHGVFDFVRTRYGGVCKTQHGSGRT